MCIFIFGVTLFLYVVTRYFHAAVPLVNDQAIWCVYYRPKIIFKLKSFSDHLRMDMFQPKIPNLVSLYGT